MCVYVVCFKKHLYWIIYGGCCCCCCCFCSSSLYILDIYPLSYIWLVNIGHISFEFTIIQKINTLIFSSLPLAFILSFVISLFSVFTDSFHSANANENHFSPWILHPPKLQLYFVLFATKLLERKSVVIAIISL